MNDFSRPLPGTSLSPHCRGSGNSDRHERDRRDCEDPGSSHSYLPLQFGGFALGGKAQLKLSPTRRIETGATVFGFTLLVKSGKCSRIWAAVLIRLPVTATRAPKPSPSFAEPMMPLFVSRLSGAQSTI